MSTVSEDDDIIVNTSLSELVLILLFIFGLILTFGYEKKSFIEQGGEHEVASRQKTDDLNKDYLQDEHDFSDSHFKPDKTQTEATNTDNKNSEINKLKEEYLEEKQKLGTIIDKLYNHNDLHRKEIGRLASIADYKDSEINKLKEEYLEEKQKLETIIKKSHYNNDLYRKEISRLASIIDEKKGRSRAYPSCLNEQNGKTKGVFKIFVYASHATLQENNLLNEHWKRLEQLGLSREVQYIIDVSKDKRGRPAYLNWERISDKLGKINKYAKSLNNNKGCQIFATYFYVLQDSSFSGVLPEEEQLEKISETASKLSDLAQSTTPSILIAMRSNLDSSNEGKRLDNFIKMKKYNPSWRKYLIDDRY